MTTLSPEQLDKARAEEASRIFHSASRTPPDPEAVIAARLARENWQPPAPVDPVLLKVREIVATKAEALAFSAEEYASGLRDGSPVMLCALAAYRAALAEAEGVINAAKELRAHIAQNACHHEETHRGGSLWTICDECGAKWADDEGGFQPHQEPATVVAFDAALLCPGAKPLTDTPIDRLEKLAEAIEGPAWKGYLWSPTEHAADLRSVLAELREARACIITTRAAEQAKHAEVVAGLVEVLEPFAEAAQGFRPDDADTMRPAVVQAVHYRRAASALQSYRSHQP